MADDNTSAEGAQDEAAKAAAEKQAAEKAAADAKASAAGTDDDLLKGARDPDAVRNALKTEREAARAAKEEAKAAQAEAKKLADQVKKFEDRDKSEQEKAEQRAADAEKEASTAKRKLLRLEVGSDKKLPLELAELLSGDTKEEMEAHADKLAKVVKAEDTVSLDGGARKSTKAPDDMNARIRAAAGR